MVPVDSRALAYNRRAFGAVIPLAAKEPLIALYASLVLIELTLKDHDPLLRRSKHNIPLMLDQLGLDSSLKIQFENGLRSLWITPENASASPTNARPKSYPDIRYLRHAMDHGTANTSDDVALIALLNLIQQSILPALRDKGIAL